jgi:hypothetical protein
MPYIRTEKREALDTAISELLNALRELESDDPSNDMGGNLNYVFTSILDKCYGQRYSEMAQAVSVLEMAKLEYYRRRAAPYETQKAHDNGDVYEQR